jgi:hypothetical protein
MMAMDAPPITYVITTSCGASVVVALGSVVVVVMEVVVVVMEVVVVAVAVVVVEVVEVAVTRFPVTFCRLNRMTCVEMCNDGAVSATTPVLPLTVNSPAINTIHHPSRRNNCLWQTSYQLLFCQQAPCLIACFPMPVGSSAASVDDVCGCSSSSL